MMKRGRKRGRNGGGVPLKPPKTFPDIPELDSVKTLTEFQEKMAKEYEHMLSERRNSAFYCGPKDKFSVKRFSDRHVVRKVQRKFPRWIPRGVAASRYVPSDLIEYMALDSDQITSEERKEEISEKKRKQQHLELLKNVLKREEQARQNEESSEEEEDVDSENVNSDEGEDEDFNDYAQNYGEEEDEDEEENRG